MTDPKEKPPDEPYTTKDQDQRGGDLKHIPDTRLPPGVDVEDAKDPGSQTPRVPADNRS